jgi:16S rRNA (adenine1518-N6/adenine1519-N6)-dimethyltransferase
LKHKARKRFGQNFLVDQDVIARIVNSIAPVKGELVVEIGPGQAALTQPLLESGANMILVEIDRDLVHRLEQQFVAQPGVSIVCADALEVDWAELTGDRPFRLVGNLPYNISTPLMFCVIEAKHTPRDMHFMLQKEVVDRLAAAPGSGDYGRLSVSCQNRCKVTPLFNISSEAFDPRPRVESALVRLQPHAEPVSGDDLAPALDQVVRQAFSQRRKTVRNSLRTMFSADDLVQLGIDGGLRAEQLTLDQFISLARFVDRHRSP